MPSVVIAGIKVRQDGEGRFSLNDLHKASGGERKNRPVHWLESEKTKELVEVKGRDSDLLPVSIVQGRNGGTYVDKTLVYAYAMWISPEFHIRVIEAYDALVNGRFEVVEAQKARANARLEAPFMTDAVKYQRLSSGKPVKHYHFSNEFNLINRIALGMTAKEYRLEHRLAANDPVRDSLTPCEIKCIEHLQRLNASMIDLGMPFETRKARLNQVYVQRHARLLFDEVQRLEA